MKNNKLSWPEPLKFGPILGNYFYVPQFRDPRYLIWIFQLGFFIFGIEAGFFSKKYNVLVTCVLCAGIIDLIITRIKTGKFILPQSGFIAGTGVALLLEGVNLWYYFIAAAIAVISKYLFKINDRHIYNPSAFGVLIITALFPNQAILNVTQWGGVYWFTLIIWATGLLVTYCAGVLTVALSWMTSFAIFAFIRSVYMGVPWINTVGVMTGASFILFAFFMITDPRTVPGPLSKRILFCFLVALVDSIFRLNQNPYAIFWGLIIGASIFHITEYIFYKESRVTII